MKERARVLWFDLSGEGEGMFSLFLVCELVDSSRWTGTGCGRDSGRVFVAIIASGEHREAIQCNNYAVVFDVERCLHLRRMT